ncbi:MAG: peptidase, partial [Gemmatimonadetes bacterium]|nr:peptidase [Gemmatimonadota bacterium]
MRKLLWISACALSATAHAQAPRTVAAPIDRYFTLARAEYSGERAKELVAYMGGWFRWPGNTAFDKSLDRVIQQLHAAGYVPEDSAGKSTLLTYRVERRPLRGPAWDLVDASLTIVGDKAPLLKLATNLNMLAINSWSTPDSGVVAELVDVGKGTAADYDKAKVAGKIVLVENGVSAGFAEAVQKRGAVGVLAYRMPAYTKPEINRSSIQFSSIPMDSAKKGWGMPISRGALDSLRSTLSHGPVRVRAMAKTKLFPSIERTVV